MKNKLVIWGSDSKDQKLLIAMELDPEANKVSYWTFPEAIVTEDFSKQLHNSWRNDAEEVKFPEGFQHFERELAVSDSILPDDLKVDRGENIQRVQTEWHFVVLSSKLNQAYRAELHELREKVDKLERYDNGLWNQLRTFWDKVQEQVHDRNLFREHADILRENINESFGKLKELRSAIDQEFHKTSNTNLDSFMESLAGVEERISRGLRLQGVFEELKTLQRKFRDVPFTRDHRVQVWERLDNAFKNIKERRYGPSNEGENGGNGVSPTERFQRRLNGLAAAVDKMKYSIDRDKEDLQFQERKIATTDGQLEAQIRQAKIVMINERIRSKEVVFSEMLTTKVELEGRIAAQVSKDAKKVEREKSDAAKEVAKKVVQEKIATEIHQAAEARKGDEKIEKAASAIASVAAPQVSAAAAVVETVAATEANKQLIAEVQAPEPVAENLTISEKIEEAVEDTVDTVKAIASVVGGKVVDFVHDLLDNKHESADETPAESEKKEEV